MISSKGHSVTSALSYGDSHKCSRFKEDTETLSLHGRHVEEFSDRFEKYHHVGSAFCVKT